MLYLCIVVLGEEFKEAWKKIAHCTKNKTDIPCWL